jgi:hypothetical protein
MTRLRIYLTAYVYPKRLNVKIRNHDAAQPGQPLSVGPAVHSNPAAGAMGENAER